MTPPASDPASRGGATTQPTFAFDVVTVDAQGQIAQRRQEQAEYRRELLPGGITLDLVKIPAGKFLMGSPEGEEGRDWYKLFNESWINVEGPQHQVSVPSFWMGKYPVTQAQWRAVVGLPKVSTDLDADPADFKGDNRPVEQVSWHEAVEFCARLSAHTGQEYRLPSEAEWEYACRAHTTTPFHFGETITPDLANYWGIDGTVEGKPVPGNYGQGPKGITRRETTDVGSFKQANTFGLYDMHGNVWEWCQDIWHDKYDNAPTDSSAWTTGGDDSYRMLRGGSWIDFPWYCRSAYRYWLRPDGRLNLDGFRVVCSSARTLS